MGIYKRSNGIYYVQLSINGKIIQKSLKTKSHVLAKDLYHVILREHLLKNWASLFLGTGKPPSDVPPKNSETPVKYPSFEKLYLKYIENCKTQNISIRTIKQKEWLLGFLKEHKMNSFKAFNSTSLNKFWESLKTRYTENSIRKFVADIKVFLNFSIKQGAFSSDEYNKLYFPSITINIRDKVFTDEHWQRIQELTRGDKDFLLYLTVLYYTGCRPNEIVNLTKNDIDENGMIKIYQSKVKKVKYVSVPPPILHLLKNCSSHKIFLGHGRQQEFYGKKFKKIRLKMGLGLDYSLFIRLGIPLPHAY